MKIRLFTLAALLLARAGWAQCVIPITVADSPYAVAAGNDSKIDCDASGGATTVTLPSAVTAGNGRVIIVKKADSSLNCCTLATTGGQTIDGQSSKTVCVTEHAMGVFSDGANWRQGPSYMLPNLPQIGLSDSSSQALASTTTGQVITFNTEESKQYMTHSTVTNTGRVTVDVAGTYMIMISALLNASTNQRTGWVWLKVNNADVPRSNTIQKIQNANAGAVIAVPFMYTFAKGDFFEIWWGGDNTTLFLQAVAAVPAPTPNSRPAVPSIIMTANLVSRAQ